MRSSRREFVKRSLTVVAGTAAMPLYHGTLSTAEADDLDRATFYKSPCRFCGTGCGVEVGVVDGRIVAVRGDDASPVNAGLLCAKGYGLAEVLYGEDRLTQPMIRNSAGALEPATWDEALNLIASRWTDLISAHGKDSVALFGSGQWTIPDGYAGLKFMKAGIRTNNLEPNARFCMASAVVGYLKTYGIDEPSGSYDDLDGADYFFLWGANMAEMHPMLFNRMQRRRQADPGVRIINFTTFGQMTNEGSDENHLFTPHSDLLLANAFAYVLVNEGMTDNSFITNHVNFRSEVTGSDVAIDMAAYTAFLADYAPAMVADRIGIPAAEIERLARMFGDPSKNVMSLWTMGVNQHTRGVWMNNLLHNLHLITGKVARLNNGPLSLTGQPSACGTCREVGTFTHRLPSDRVVANAEHRAEMETLWSLPAGTLPSPADSPLTHATAMWEKVAAGDIKSIWVSCTNPYQTLPNLNKYVDRIRSSGAFIIVSDIYPSASTIEADVVLPAACWVEKEGFFGNTERRTQHFAQLVNPPGEARDDTWQFVEVARRMGFGSLFPASWDANLARNLYNEYRSCTLGTKHDVATYDDLVASRGLRWPVIGGVETQIRFNSTYDPYVSASAPDGIEFYGKPDGRAVVWARPYEPPAESPDATYPFWLCTGRVLEHWHTGTMTRRIRALHQTQPEALAYLSNADAASLGVSAGDMVRITSRRGTIEARAALECRITVPDGMVYVPFFDQSRMINLVTLGAIDPQSKQPDYKKCAVQIERVA
ncbi:MAG: molybdopterin-dependent oxidoreductase [Deltaproteobacteria bacterium]|nr:molybdopterin-dependent oxidoreductase [Deltaproteobacteria bacterium]